MPQKQGDGSQVILDWATVSYRSIMRGVVYLVLLVSLGGLFFYLKASLRTTPEEMALQEIGLAERLQKEAQAVASTKPGSQRTVGSASQLLSEARASYDRKDYALARATAQQSQALAQKILEGSPDESFTAKIYKFEGDVKIKRARQFVWDTVNGNPALRVGDQIKTASNGSAQIVYFDGTITTIKPGSLLEIRELFEDPTTKVRKIREKLNFGGVSATTVEANVPGSFHEVATDSATARAVSKARFEVAYDAATQSARTEVQSGTAEVQSAGRTTTLQPLERIEVTRDRIVSRTTVLPSPTLLEPVGQRVFRVEDASVASTALRWARVDGSVRYRLQIARSGLFGELLLDKSDIRSSKVQIPGLPEGSYYWRVSTFDAKSVESAFSETRKFIVSSAMSRRATDREPPPLAVQDFLPSGHLVIISGRTEPGSLLTVDGQSIDVYDDGAFTAVVRMKREGRNEVEIVAQDTAGNETRLKRVVFVESF
jgi:hypothetical protein